MIPEHLLNELVVHVSLQDLQDQDCSGNCYRLSAQRDLFVRRLELEEGASPDRERVWFRKHGGNTSEHGSVEILFFRELFT